MKTATPLPTTPAEEQRCGHCAHDVADHDADLLVCTQLFVDPMTGAESFCDCLRPS